MTRRRDLVVFSSEPMIGSGLTGRVFAATLLGIPVAIKVTPRRLQAASVAIAAGDSVAIKVKSIAVAELCFLSAGPLGEHASHSSARPTRRIKHK